MKQRLFLSVFIALLMPMAVWADLNVDDTFKVNGIIYKVTSTNPREVQVDWQERKVTGDLDIPSSVTGTDGNSYSVTSIGDVAFYGCAELTSIFIPASVTSIGLNIVGCCNNMTSIKVDNDNNVYDSRNSCNAIILTESNKVIAGYKNSTIPNTITTIGEYNQEIKGKTNVEIIPVSA